MKRSIRAKLYLMFSLLGIIILLMILNYSMHKAVEKWEHKYATINEIHNKFVHNISRELSSLQDLEDFSNLQKSYKELQSSCLNCHDSDVGHFLQTRTTILEDLYNNRLASIKLRETVHDGLNELTESVRYIHEHHIATLKNFLKRNILREDAYPDDPVQTKNSVRSAPELDIIEQTVTIQRSLADILRNFYALKDSRTPHTLQNKFSENISLFFNAVNTFESFSLDAQDGLLVEELLDSGRTFESSFTELVQREEIKRKLFTKLQKNQKEHTGSALEMIETIKTNRDRLNNQLNVLEVSSFLFTALLILFIIQQGQTIIRSINRLVTETGKIKKDYTYRIQEDQTTENEFRILSIALNNMAENLNERIRKLNEEIQLRTKVEKERTKTEAKLQRAQKMEAIGLMAGGVAHDLNNILSGVVSYPELLLLQLPKNSKLRKSLEAIRDSGQRAATIVADLLTVARGAAATREVHDLNSLAREYLSSPECNKLMSLYPNVTHRQQFDAVHPNISCSPVHIKKCLMNLVTNAVEAIADDGTILITTHNKNIDDAADSAGDIKKGDYVVLSVQDSGSGISDKDLEHIFEPFYTKKVMGRSGTGLGLTVVWNTMQDHGGKIHTISDSKGTCFQLYFPVATEKGVARVGKDKKEKFTGSGEHILVVDDEPQLRDIASQILQSLGYKVDSVSSGESAIKFMEKSPVDLILIDMLMAPGMNGRQTFEEIIKLYPGQKAIIVSGFSESDDVKETLKLGVECFIKKPYSIDQLGCAVKEVLRNEN